MQKADSVKKSTSKKGFISAKSYLTVVIQLGVWLLLCFTRFIVLYRLAKLFLKTSALNRKLRLRVAPISHLENI
jgi:hypothetical protein